MTNSQKGLYGRWSQFQTAIYGKGGHSGGNSVHKQLGYYNTWKKKLFVCGMSVKCNVYKGERSPSDLIKMGWVAFLEYEALAEYKERIGKEPEFHKK